MVIKLTQNELAYIQSEYNFKSLCGVAPFLHNKRKAEKSLLEKGMIFPVRDLFELSNELRLMLATWANARFTMTRPDLHDRNFDIVLLTDETCVLYFKREKDTYSIRFVDMDDSIMDFYMESCMQLNDPADVKNPFNVQISMADLDMLIKDGGNAALTTLSGKTGLPVDWLRVYRQVILSTEFPETACSLVLTEDLRDNVGCLTKLMKTDGGIFGFKHVTAPDGETAVLMKGNKNFIIDCMYNF